MGPKREGMRDAGLLWLRILMGVGIAIHGYQKLFGGHLAELTDDVAKLGLPGQPGTLALLAAWSEFAGGVLVVIGLATRLAALMIFGTMFVAAFLQLKHAPLADRELALAYWTMAGALVLMGAGRFSIDAALVGHFHGGGAAKPKIK